MSDYLGGVVIGMAGDGILTTSPVFMVLAIALAFIICFIPDKENM